MSRVIKFRGKSLMPIEELALLDIEHENGWVIGNLIISDELSFIVGPIVEATYEYLTHEWWVPVDPKTVGQFTGILDLNSQEIYEGDICKRTLVNFYEIKVFGDEIIGTVEYQEDTYWIDFKRDATSLFCEVNPTEVIGNIYEHPHLLEVAE